MKTCAVCKRPLESGLLVHPGCVMQWVCINEQMPPHREEVFLYDAVNRIYDVGYWDDTEKAWYWNYSEDSTKYRYAWTHWAIPVPPGGPIYPPKEDEE